MRNAPLAKDDEVWFDLEYSGGLCPPYWVGPPSRMRSMSDSNRCMASAADCAREWPVQLHSCRLRGRSALKFFIPANHLVAVPPRYLFPPLTLVTYDGWTLNKRVSNLKYPEDHLHLKIPPSHSQRGTFIDNLQELGSSHKIYLSLIERLIPRDWQLHFNCGAFA